MEVLTNYVVAYSYVGRNLKAVFCTCSQWYNLFLFILQIIYNLVCNTDNRSSLISYTGCLMSDKVLCQLYTKQLQQLFIKLLANLFQHTEIATYTQLASYIATDTDAAHRIQYIYVYQFCYRSTGKYLYLSPSAWTFFKEN